MLANLVENNNVAIYCRLSREDGDSIESSSIKNQKEFLSQYALKNNWNIYDVYIDDGYSGGNFNRPSFKRMIDDIEKGNISILLTKDLSRLGRNYIEAGYYTEEYFPEHNIRYIAVNDNYDSNKEESIDFTPFKNIINQWYLKDISKKVKASNELRMKKGILPKNLRIPLYGYKQDEKNERVKDLETAKIVEKIFDMYCNGSSVFEISNYLETNKIPTPAYYNYLTYNYNANSWIDADDKKKYHWHRGIITKLLGNSEYAGDLILSRKKVTSYKTHKRINTPKSEILYFKNRFEPIVSREVVDKAKELLTKRRRSEVPVSINIYKNLLYCSNCGKSLSYYRFNPCKKNRSKGKTVYRCRNSKCPSNNEIRIETISKIVNLELSNLFVFFLKHEDELKKYAMTYKNSTYELPSNDKIQLDNLIKRNKKINLLIQRLFEKNSFGEIPYDTYNQMLKKYKEEYEDNKSKIDEFNSRIQKIDNKDYVSLVEEFINKLKEFQDKDVSREILQEIVYKIYVYKEGKEGRIRIVFRNIPELLESYVEWKKIEN